MKLLIDTATKYLIVALLDDKVISQTILEGHNDHSKTLMVEIEKILESNALSVDDIDEIIVGEGPGSYTGVRIGVVVAKTMAYALDIPLYKVSSLNVLATSSEGEVPVMIDARRGSVFSAVYKGNNILIEEKMRSLEEFESLIEKEPITINNMDLNLHRLEPVKVDDIHTFSPNYLRQWGE